jgi:hypothetical protein
MHPSAPTTEHDETCPWQGNTEPLTSPYHYPHRCPHSYHFTIPLALSFFFRFFTFPPTLPSGQKTRLKGQFLLHSSLSSYPLGFPPHIGSLMPLFSHSLHHHGHLLKSLYLPSSPYGLKNDPFEVCSFVFSPSCYWSTQGLHYQFSLLHIHISSSLCSAYYLRLKMK